MRVGSADAWNEFDADGAKEQLTFDIGGRLILGFVGDGGSTGSPHGLECHKLWHMVLLNGMRLRIDKSGRIVVPKPLRERLGLKPGTELEAVKEQGVMLLRTVEERPALVKVDGL